MSISLRIRTGRLEEDLESIVREANPCSVIRDNAGSNPARSILTPCERMWHIAVRRDLSVVFGGSPLGLSRQKGKGRARMCPGAEVVFRSNPAPLIFLRIGGGEGLSHRMILPQ